MKPSGIEWIGDIPDDWEVIKTKFLFNVYGGSTPKVNVPEYWGDKITWITPGELGDDTKIVLNSKRMLSEKGLNSCGATLVPKESIIISSRAPIGQVCLAGSELCTNQGCKSLVAKIKLSCLFFYYFFKVQSEVLNMLGNGTTFMELSTSDLLNFKIPFPPLKTQQKIADYLDEKCGEIDATIAKQKESIEKLKAYKQSLISETVTKGLDKSAPLKPSGIDYLGDIPSHWEIKKLKYVAEVDPTISEFLSDNDIVSFAPMECLGEQTLSPYETEYGKVKGKYTYFANEDIIMAKVTPCFENGNIAIAKNLKNNVGFGSSELFVFRAKNISNSFLMYSLYSEPFKSLAKSTMYGTGGLKRVSPNFILNYKIPLPPLKTQERIADYLDSKCSQIDKYITEKQNIIQKLDAYKKSLIFECVTGKQKN